MKDYSSRPYAKWIDNVILELFDVDPDSIYIGIIKDGEVKSTCWEIGQDERAALIQDILVIGVFEVVERNRDRFKEMAAEAFREFLDNKFDNHDEDEDEDEDEEYNEYEEDEE